MIRGENDEPESVEEAGALLGAAITKCNVTKLPSIKPPKGMHSSFATMSPAPASELFCRLYQLRELLRKLPKNSQLVAAPSLLAVLMKLLGVSSSLAAQFIQDGRVNTPPLWSTPLRKLWVDSVVLCHILGESLTGNSRIDIYSFVKNMVALAGLNPKSQKAGGGTRMAALQVIGGIFLELPQKLSPWALDVLHLCLKSLKSSGNGEPSYRVAAVQTATAVAKACFEARLEQQRLDRSAVMILPGAVEDRALQESIKLLKQATMDKYPEVRQAAAQFCSTMSPMFVLSRVSSSDSSNSSITSILDDAIAICTKNLDDESTAVAVAWAEALARCLSTAIARGKETQSDITRKNNGEGSDANDGSNRRKTFSVASTCKSLQASVRYLVQQFVKAGGESSASRMGGQFSVGGRAVRVGYSIVIAKILGIFSNVPGTIGLDYSVQQIIVDILVMLGSDFEKQLNAKTALNIAAAAAVSASNLTSQTKGSIFGVKNKSKADRGVACLATVRAIREGLSEISSESTQLSILYSLIGLCTGSVTDAENVKPLNSQQIQACLIEISHLVTSLGEVAGSALEDLVPFLTNSIQSPHHGVRHETAVACAALAASFPAHARELLNSCIAQIQVQHAELVTQATIDEAKPTVPKKKLRFQRKEDQPIDKSVHFQYAIHGYALVISLLLRELPKLPGGLPAESLSMAMSVGEILVTCQYIEILTKINPNGACTCVRAGYLIICGALTVDPAAMTPHIPLIFRLWQRAGESSEKGVQNFESDQDVICLDAALSSIVAFLENCSELLLDIPEALSKTTTLLEQVLPLFMQDGRLFITPSDDSIAPRYNSAKASIMEAFAWLPPGSFPMIANKVFIFAISHVQSATESEVMCSLLPSLVNNEDKVLDAKSICRAQRYGQVGGIRDIDNNCIMLKSEVVHDGERESVMHFQCNGSKSTYDRVENDLWRSRILGLFNFDGIDLNPPPTALHEVGTWRKPVTSSCSSKVRLVDAAVQAFSATFGLKDGKEQQQAMILLEQMVPPLLAQLARTMGVNASSSEGERRGKAKDDIAAVANITAVLLACLKALPLHEATHDIPIGLGPPWMNKAKDLLLTLIPSTSNIVRRAAAEGLALLATLGVTEDAHTLQSTVLHSLDEVMQGNKPDGKPRALPVEPVSGARAGSLLTLGCIQRTAYNIKMMHKARSKGRTSTSEIVAAAQRDALPTMQMMTRILPSIACHAAIRDAFVPRTYGLHTFNILLAYSTYQKEEWTVEDEHLLKKAIEIIEDNFLSCWAAVSTDVDGGQEHERLAAEVSFLSVILRMMTLSIPFTDKPTSSRFTQIASMLREECFEHPIIMMECMAFFELLAKQKENVDTICLKSTNGEILEIIASRPTQSLQSVKASAILSQTTTQDSNLSSLFSLLDSIIRMKPCITESSFRYLATPRDADEQQCQTTMVENAIIKALIAQKDHILKSRQFIGNQTRWQVRAIALALISKEVAGKVTVDFDIISELLSSACGAIIATCESYDIRPVQEAGAQLLLELIKAFGHLKDPADPAALYMDQFSSQIFSSVKSSLTLPGGNENENENERAYNLFHIGCELLEELLKKEIITEAGAFKRLVRSIILPIEEMDVVNLNSDPSQNCFREKSILLHVAKLTSISRIVSLIERDEISEKIVSFLTDKVRSCAGNLAVHCAAVALDSWRLSKGNTEASFFFGNILDLDDKMKNTIVNGGPPCLCNAMTLLVEIIPSVDDSEAKNFKGWLDLLVSLAITSFHEKVKLLINESDTSTSLLQELKPSESMLYYLRGIRAVLHLDTTNFEIFNNGGAGEIILLVAKEIIFPAMGLSLVQGDNAGIIYQSTSSDESLVLEACKFLECMAISNYSGGESESKLLYSLVTPLDALQRGDLKLARSFEDKVIDLLLKAANSLITKNKAKPSFVNGMLQLSIELLLKDLNAELSKTVEAILRNCFAHDSITSAQQQSIAATMAKEENWKVWSMIVTGDSGALLKSLPIVKEALDDIQNASRHVGALSVVRAVLQSIDGAEIPFIGIIMKYTGGPCLGLCKAYATLTLPIEDAETHRMTVCTDVMKIIMISFQHLITTQKPLPPYLSIVFELFISVLQYNGLPNQASPQPGANPILGRLAAQAIVHVARTTPEPFKEVVSRLEAHPRALLEFAFRAETSGYATASNAAPQKKKLDLKSFKR